MKAAAALVLAALASSPSFDPARAHAEAHTVPGKLIFEPPAGWTEVSPEAYLDNIKKNIGLAPPEARKAVKSASAPLVVFLGADSGMFRSNLNVREIKGGPTIDEKAVAEYSKHALKAFGSSVKPTLDEINLIDVDGKMALRAVLAYKLAGHSLKGVQAVFRGKGSTFIATYSVPAASYPNDQAVIDASIQSFRFPFSEPWHSFITTRPILLYGLIGMVGGLILVLVFRRRSA